MHFVGQLIPFNYAQFIPIALVFVVIHSVAPDMDIQWSWIQRKIPWVRWVNKVTKHRGDLHTLSGLAFIVLAIYLPVFIAIEVLYFWQTGQYLVLPLKENVNLIVFVAGSVVFSHGFHIFLDKIS